MFASLLRGGRVGGWGECRVNFKRIEFAFNRLHVFPLTLKAPIMTAADDSLEYFIIVFQRKKKDLIFHVNPLLGRGFTRNIKNYYPAEDSHETSGLIFLER